MSWKVQVQAGDTKPHTDGVGYEIKIVVVGKPVQLGSLLSLVETTVQRELDRVASPPKPPPVPPEAVREAGGA